MVWHPVFYLQLFQSADPSIAQSLIFCEIAPNGTTRSFYRAAGNGETLVTFSADAGIWAAQKKDKVAVYIADVLNQDKGTIAILQSLFTEFVKLVKTFLQTRKMAVERQGKAEYCTYFTSTCYNA